jgi:formylglycine-generating enzyme required for sulfatase activity
MTRFSVVVLVACSSQPDPVPPSATTAPLSLAKEQHMVLVPGGQYISGSTYEERSAAYDEYLATAGHDTAREKKWFDGEAERHMATLPAFRIDLMPVTQAEFAEYVTEKLAPAPAIDEAQWKAQGFVQHYSVVQRFVWQDGRPPIGREDHPVVLVTWQEADGYCKWRGKLIGSERRLPTDAEFEKAARGSDGSVYPWGSDYDAHKLNSAVKGPGDTTPVGNFVAGASPLGVLDAAGNVFQWTASRFQPGQMTVKGSAWESFGGMGRGASRHGRAVNARHVIVGFRCAANA